MKPTIKYVRIVPEAKEPQLATDGSSGYDVYACRVLDKETKRMISDLKEPFSIWPGESVLFGSGLAIEIPPTHDAAIYSRSGLAAKCDIEVGYPGAPIDSDYRGEFTILLRNKSRKGLMVQKFMRIAQLVFRPRVLVEWVELTELSKTERGDRGHGSSGLY